ncbi:hypothetical protein P154DRAFT_182558 [Amniculicola lignicola CBS 123094]|uniref:Uncharacterized protein n=1 Tax=Amniculicola lignicola CBS 123094 TaxID=1392246 RepID=A0A6A5X0K4_9PLEO|nr:hypothetical protein P154DRAFT_182558 [Amniculicola lignicola CBS 123094]
MASLAASQLARYRALGGLLHVQQPSHPPAPLSEQPQNRQRQRQHSTPALPLWCCTKRLVCVFLYECLAVG